jgi:hypothetical protein
MKNFIIYALFGIFLHPTVSAAPHFLSQNALIREYHAFALKAGYDKSEITGLCQGLALHFIVNFTNGNKELFEVSQLLTEYNAKTLSLENPEKLKVFEKKISKFFQEVCVAHGDLEFYEKHLSLDTAIACTNLPKDDLEKLGLDLKNLANRSPGLFQKLLAYNALPEQYSPEDVEEVFHSKIKKQPLGYISKFSPDAFNKAEDFALLFSNDALFFPDYAPFFRKNLFYNNSINLGKAIHAVRDHILTIQRRANQAPVFSFLNKIMKIMEYLPEAVLAYTSPLRSLMRFHTKEVLKDKSPEALQSTPAIELAQEIVWSLAQKLDAELIIYQNPVNATDYANRFKASLKDALSEPGTAVLLGVDEKIREEVIIKELQKKLEEATKKAQEEKKKLQVLENEIKKLDSERKNLKNSLQESLSKNLEEPPISPIEPHLNIENLEVNHAIALIREKENFILFNANDTIVESYSSMDELLDKYLLPSYFPFQGEDKLGTPYHIVKIHLPVDEANSG